MWSALGLDLEKHDALLEALGQAYQSLFIDRAGRPKGMEYFDFVMSEVHGLRIKELLDAKAAGRKIVGSFCVFVPEELILAVDGVSVGLCAGAEFGFDKAELYLPRSTCSLIKSFFGFTLERVCPYIASCDLVVGENTCDGKKKAYEPFAELVNDLYVLDMPQVKSAEGRDLLAAEYRRFAKKLEKLSGKTITPESLRRGIEIVNAKRAAVHRLAALRSADPAPVAGLDALLINQVFFYDDPVRFTKSVNAICDEIEARVARGEGVAPAKTPRILISGCPMAVPNWKLPAIVESAGAVIVGEESCVGERGTQFLTLGDSPTVEGMIEAIVDRYWKIDCAIFTPNPSRLDHVTQLAREHHADGVIHYSLQFCTPYQMESGGVERELEKRGIPILKIDTDYSQEDVEQLRTRVEAFIERIRG
jgi:benzoyl-CoA reductase/2-hydroxyglutaryl-CoA dehydratase subunit BcrC/BadD/HgdB